MGQGRLTRNDRIPRKPTVSKPSANVAKTQAESAAKSGYFAAVGDVLSLSSQARTSAIETSIMEY